MGTTSNPTTHRVDANERKSLMDDFQQQQQDEERLQHEILGALWNLAATGHQEQADLIANLTGMSHIWRQEVRALNGRRTACLA